tara:strand:- start:942 stop:1286 length:345 start_codon:yes stop_codon:yes gene_type:complete
MKFKENYSEHMRIQESNKILIKYPTRIPIILEKSDNCILNDITKKKYLVPKDLTLQQFIFIIRKKINLDPSQALFIMVNNKLCPASLNIGDVYEKDKDKDGFLYITYTSENTFG